MSTPTMETLALLPNGLKRTGPAHPGRGYHGLSPAARVVANWHNDTHPGAFQTCGEQPCHATRSVDEQAVRNLAAVDIETVDEPDFMHLVD